MQFWFLFLIFRKSVMLEVHQNKQAVKGKEKKKRQFNIMFPQ